VSEDESEQDDSGGQQPSEQLGEATAMVLIPACVDEVVPMAIMRTGEPANGGEPSDCVDEEGDCSEKIAQ
jgi:hypothetical protein